MVTNCCIIIKNSSEGAIINPFKYSDDNKRYHTLAYHNKQTGEKSKKAVIDAGLSCPNIDGTKGRGGCIYCDGGSGYFTGDPEVSIANQLKAERDRIFVRTPGVSITGYFQAHTNTYCSPMKLKAMLDEAIGTGIIDSVALATRPDCLSDAVIAVLSEYSKIIPLSLELGLQTANDRTAKLINRCYDFEVFEKNLLKLKSAGIRTCVHIIDGLPGESHSDMLRTAEKLAELRPEGIKIHLLHVIEGTVLAEMWHREEYIPMSFEDYVETVIDQLELLPPEMVIERITGDADKTKLLAPMWSKDKIRVLGTIDKRMAVRNTWQGRLYTLESEECL